MKKVGFGLGFMDVLVFLKSELAILFFVQFVGCVIADNHYWKS